MGPLVMVQAHYSKGALFQIGRTDLAVSQSTLPNNWGIWERTVTRQSFRRNPKSSKISTAQVPGHGPLYASGG